MGRIMALAPQMFRTAVLPVTLLRMVGAIPRMPFGAGAPQRQADRYGAGPLDPGAMCDIGACREYQDYACAAEAPATPARRLHRIADAVRWGSPR
jgi:hypothetical protein